MTLDSCGMPCDHIRHETATCETIQNKFRYSITLDSYDVPQDDMRQCDMIWDSGHDMTIKYWKVVM